MQKATPKTIKVYFSEMGKKGGRTGGPSKVRGDRDYYARLRRLYLAKKAAAENNPPPLH